MPLESFEIEVFNSYVYDIMADRYGNSENPVFQTVASVFSCLNAPSTTV